MAPTVNRFASLQLAIDEDGSYEISDANNLLIINSRDGQVRESRLTSRELEFVFQKVFKLMADKHSPNTPTANHCLKPITKLTF